MMKLGKKKILAIVTAGAMVVSTALTFAAWDQLKTTESGTVTLRKPVSVVAELAAFNETEGTLTEGSYTTTGTFTVTPADLPTYVTKAKLEMTPTLKLDDEVDTTHFDVAIIKEGTTITPSGDVFTDDAPDKAAANTYTVKITPKTALTTTEAKNLYDGLASKDVTVEIGVELIDTTSYTAP